MEQKSLEDNIKALLSKYPKTRDSDIELYARYLQQELPEQFKNLLVLDLFKLIKNGTLSSVETVGRCRRKIQENDESLRGENYKNRQDLAKTIAKKGFFEYKTVD